MTIAAVVITKDEEGNIADCLESVRWADELIVVDAESRDRTVEVARRYTSRVFVRPWAGYGPQKNFGIDQAHAIAEQLGMSFHFLPRFSIQQVGMRLRTLPAPALGAAVGAAILVIDAMRPDGVAPFIYYQF